MSKPFIALLFGGVFFCLGLLTAATLIEYEPRRVADQVLDEAIVLRIPKTESDIARHLLYREAELAMLKELQRQNNLSKGPSPSIPTSKTSTKHKLTAPKGG